MDLTTIAWQDAYHKLSKSAFGLWLYLLEHPDTPRSPQFIAEQTDLMTKGTASKAYAELDQMGFITKRGIALSTPLKEGYRAFCVYQFRFPDGKYYIGITSQIPKDRWQHGEGYTGQKVYAAIQQYGWDNIEKSILIEGLTEIEARQKEHELIQQYNSCADGYNTIP